MNQQSKLEKSKMILDLATSLYKPYAVILAMSGGDDSLTAYQVCKSLGVKIDFLLHVNTRTGIQQTSEFVVELARQEGLKLLYMDAGSTYEKLVLSRGFLGKGTEAHTISYHELKDHFFSRAIASIRQRKRGRNILIINGLRASESAPRQKRYTDNPIKGTDSNIWVNAINDWDKNDCLDFLADLKVCRNPVSIQLCRSGECMCGTMQSQLERDEAAALYPEWGRWLDDLERQVMVNFPWRWGDLVPKGFFKAKKTKKINETDQLLCQSCLKNQDE